MEDIKSTTTYNLSTDEEQQCGEPTSTRMQGGEKNLDHHFRDLRLGTGMAHEEGFTLDGVSELYDHPWYGHFPQFCKDDLPPKPNMLRNVDDDVYENFVNDLAQSMRNQCKFYIFFLSLLTAFLVFSLAAEFCPDDYHDLLSYVGVAFLCLACLSIFLLLCKRLQLDPRYVVEKHHGHFLHQGIKLEYVEYKLFVGGERGDLPSSYIVFSEAMPKHMSGRRPASVPVGREIRYPNSRFWRDPWEDFRIAWRNHFYLINKYSENGHTQKVGDVVV